MAICTSDGVRLVFHLIRRNRRQNPPSSASSFFDMHPCAGGSGASLCPRSALILVVSGAYLSAEVGDGHSLTGGRSGSALLGLPGSGRACRSWSLGASHLQGRCPEGSLERAGLVSAVSDYLRRAQHRPGLRFEAPAGERAGARHVSRVSRKLRGLR
jgi:hypothetical protein